MPAWVIPFLVKYLLPFLLNELVKQKVLTQLEADSINTVGDFVVWVQSLKTYQEYPSQKDGDFERMPPASTNLNRTPDA